MNIEIVPCKQKELPYQVFLEVEDERYLTQAYELSKLFTDCSNENRIIDFELAKAQIKAEPGLAIIATLNVELNKSSPIYAYFRHSRPTDCTRFIRYFR